MKSSARCTCVQLCAVAARSSELPLQLCCWRRLAVAAECSLLLTSPGGLPQVEEGLSNARKYRLPGSPMHLRATVEAVAASPAAPRDAELHVVLSNLGSTLLTPTDERAESGMYSKQYLLNQLTVLLGPRVAEELAFGAEGVRSASLTRCNLMYRLSSPSASQWSS